MANNKGPKGDRDGQGRSGDLLSGLTTKMPSADDNSTRIKGGSVDSDTTRKDTAKSPGTLGPRTA